MNSFPASWLRAWHGVGAGGDGATVLQSLLARYAEPHRRYHTQQHLAECLDAFETVKSLPPRPAEVEAALWFHDAIYDVKRNDNEELSAEWAESALLSAGASREAAHLVCDLVLVTKHAAAPVTPDECVLIDIDLGILGSAASRFAEYEQQIREEYAFVPAWLFKRKRRSILRSFLKRPRIYSTEHFHKALEQRARQNLLAAMGQHGA
jgi:predicted metal-dependent HD superfamily phosphohydrolase